MVRHSFFQLVVLVTLFLQVRCSPFALQKRGACATEDPDADFLHEVRRLQSDEADPAGSQARTAPIEIETWFHIISSKSESTQVTDDMINSQLSILQQSYADSGISYRLQGVTRHVNDKWASNADDTAMKTTLRKGSYRTLNVYFQTDLQASPGQAGRAFGHRGAVTNNDLASSVLGFCTLPDPSVNASSPASHYIKDGCNVLAKTMPGGSLDLYNRGGTAIHEIGHWNGLLHTFQGESCSVDNPGDHISDTPQQSTPTDGCPDRKDSCPDSPDWTPSTTSWIIHLMYAMRTSHPDKESACGVCGYPCVKGNSATVTGNESNTGSVWSPFEAIGTRRRRKVRIRLAGYASWLLRFRNTICLKTC